MVVYVFDVELVGKTPILQHNPNVILKEEEWKKEHGRNLVPPPELSAEWSTYRNKEGYLCIPEKWIRGALRNVAKRMKIKGMRGKTAITIMGAIQIEPLLIPLYRDGKLIKDYEMHSEWVNVQRSKVLRARPMIDVPWNAKFKLYYNSLIGGIEPGSVKKLIEMTGQIGIGDWRPERGGTYGTYDVKVSIKEA